MATRRRAHLVVGAAAMLVLLALMTWLLADRAGLFLARGHASVAEFGAKAVALRAVHGDLVVTLLRDGRTVRLERMTWPGLGILSPRRLLWELDYKQTMREWSGMGFVFRGPPLASKVDFSK